MGRKNIKDMIDFYKLPKYGSEEWFSTKDFPQEVWVDVPGYEGLYSVSCYGRVKSYQFVKDARKHNPHIKVKIVATPMGKNGYQHVSFYRNGTTKICSLHKLVASVFEIDRACEGDIINHKDENRWNNCVSNLEYCSHKYNSNYGNAQKKHVETRKERGLLRAVIRIDDDGNTKRYDSIHEAARDMNSSPNNVWCCCTGRSKTVKGSKFCYESDYCSK